MLNEEFNKIYSGKSPFYKGIVLMAVIVKCDMAAIIGINAIEGNDGSSKIAADIFDHCIGITEIRFGINIKVIFIIAVDKILGCFKSRSNT